MTVDAVLFDLDGTLLDTAPDFYTSVNLLRAEEGLPSISEPEIRRTVSNGSRALVTLAFGLEPGDSGFDNFLQRLLAIYSKNLAVNSVLFPGMQKLLSLLEKNGIQWGIVTNKPLFYTSAILENLKLNPAPACVICPDHVTNTKPDPEPLYLACKEISSNPENIIYVGDHQRDIDCGKNAGSITIAVSYGYITEGESPADWHADYLIDHADEIFDIVQKHHSL